MPTYTRFRTTNDIGDYGLSEQLETNLIEFFKWGFLNIGAFFNVRIPSSGSYGGSPHILKLTYDANYDKGQVWQSHRKDWIWESGTEYSSQPIQISGVFIGNTFYPTSTTGTYSYKIDYPNGRVIFDEAIPNNSTVKCEYSYRYYTFPESSNPWLKIIHPHSFRSDDNNLNIYGSGMWNTSPEKRIQMPMISIRAKPNFQKFEGRGIGSLYRWVNQQVECFILAETDFDMKQAHDIFVDQVEKQIKMFDMNRLESLNSFPLKADGSLSATPKCYPDLVAETGVGGFYWKDMIFDSVRSFENPEYAPYFACTVQYSIKTHMP